MTQKPQTAEQRALRRRIDVATCPGCAKGYPIAKGRHQTWDDGSIDFECQSKVIELWPIVRQAILDEREACAKICDTMPLADSKNKAWLAAAIRSRT